jgi:hypothetical protein|tara:strand:+ start:11759 stop:11905 length:147 start_codon:yes stop_codon:yes gene_type:complete
MPTIEELKAMVTQLEAQKKTLKFLLKASGKRIQTLEILAKHKIYGNKH